MVELKTAVTLNVMKQVKDTATVLATNMLSDFVKTQESIQQAAQAPHPTAGLRIDIRA